jgi:hypothetical protein
LLEAATTINLLLQVDQAADHLISRLLLTISQFSTDANRATRSSTKLLSHFFGSGRVVGNPEVAVSDHLRPTKEFRNSFST